MILVVLAMRACSSPRREKSVCPVVASITVARLAGKGLGLYWQKQNGS